MTTTSSASTTRGVPTEPPSSRWQNNYFNDLIDKEIEQDNFLIKPIEIEEGVLECKCGSKRVFSYQKQCRGGDESSTTFAECVACKSKWIYSG